MTSMEPITSGIPSRTVTLPEYVVFVRFTNWRHVVGRSLTRSVRYMNPVVPQSFATEKRSVTVHFDRPEDFRDFFKRAYGPTIVTYRGIADDPDKVAALDAALLELGRAAMDERGWMRWEYLLLTAHRAV